MEPKISSVYVVVAILFTFTAAQFFTDEGDDDNSNEGNVGIKVPGRCPDDQLFYPGSATDGNNGTCDCAAGFIYFPKEDKCFPAYRRGPCKENEYVVLKKPANNAACVRNPCRIDTMVRYKNSCYKLSNSNGCPMKGGEKGVLDVNATTLELKCLYGNVAQLNLIDVSSCPPGSKRAVTGQCRKPY